MDKSLSKIKDVTLECTFHDLYYDQVYWTVNDANITSGGMYQVSAPVYDFLTRKTVTGLTITYTSPADVRGVFTDNCTQSGRLVVCSATYKCHATVTGFIFKYSSDARVSASVGMYCYKYNG